MYFFNCFVKESYNFLNVKYSISLRKHAWHISSEQNDKKRMFWEKSMLLKCHAAKITSWVYSYLGKCTFTIFLTSNNIPFPQKLADWEDFEGLPEYM